MDRWFLSIVAEHYRPLRRNEKAMLNVADTMSNMSLCYPANPRLQDVVSFLAENKQPRSLPTSPELTDSDSATMTNQSNINLSADRHRGRGLRRWPRPTEHAKGDQENESEVELYDEQWGADWLSLIWRRASPHDLARRSEEYDHFEITFQRVDLLDFVVNDGAASNHLVWRGIQFKLCLVRTRSEEQSRDSVGVYLLSHGPAGCEPAHLFLKFSVKARNHDIDIHCNSFKRLQLGSHRRTTGIADFFECDWQTFLDT